MHDTNARTELRGRQERGSRFVSSPLDETDDDDTSFYDRGFDDNQMQMMNMTQTQIAQREKDIKQIAKSIQEIAVLFNDLANLVQEQGTILDRIDYNIEQATYHTKEAVVQLRGAQEESKKYGNKLCILLLIVLIFGVVVAIIVKVSK
jgi:syntaxin 16